MAKVAKFNIPPSSSVVNVRVIDSTARIKVAMNMVAPAIKGHDILDCPTFSFLVEHPSGRKVLFDLGVRKDWENMAPLLVAHAKAENWKISVEKSVAEQLEENGIDRKSIEAIIWSHWHWDHIGNPSEFYASTALIVGPGFKKMFVPAFPENPASPILQSDYEGRELRELSIPAEGGPKVGRFDAIDYFGDGSFYILDGPGHTIGHLCALARVTSEPASYILMGADSCHHSGEMRPSPYLSLPSSISPNPVEPHRQTPCPSSLFEHLFRDGDGTKPFYGQKRPGILLSDPDVADQTIEKLQEADVDPNIFVIIAHDKHLLDVIDFFPKYVNDFVSKGWAQQTKWSFLQDFKQALN